MVKLSEVKKVLVVAEDGRFHTCPLELLKGPKGDDGDTPTETYLRELIKDHIPDPIQGDPGDPGAPGESPTDEHLKSLIVPLIPDPIPGETPTVELLKSIIEPLIPVPIKGDAGYTPSDEHISGLITKQLPTRAQICDMLIPYIPLPLQGDPGVAPKMEDILKQLPPFPTEEDVRKLILELSPKPEPVEGLPPLPTVRRANRILGTDHRGKLGWLAAVVGATGRSLVQTQRLNALEQGGVGSGSPGVGGGGTWGSIIGTLSDQLDLQVELDALYAAIAGVGSNASQTTFLVNGGQVVWVQQYQFLVSAATYYIGGSLFSSAQQTITLDPSHATLDRIDVIAVDNTGTVIKITGTAATEPSEPDTDPGSQLKLSIVFVRANTTQPSFADTETIYAELQSSGEWDPSTSGSGWSTGASADPRTGLFHIDATNVGASSYIQFQLPSSQVIDPAAFDQLALNIKPKSQWGNNRGVQITLRKSGVVKGASVVVQRSGTFGFESGLTSLYQQVAIPIGLFSVPAGQLIDQVRVSVFGGAVNFLADDISFIGGATGQFATGITQEQADARYGFRVLQGVVTDPNGSNLAVGDRQGAPIVIPQEMHGWKLTRVSGHVTTPSTSGVPTIQLHNLTQALDLLSTRITIDVNEKDSTTAAVAPVINLSNQLVNAGDEIWTDVDVAGTNTKGLIVTLTFERA